MKNIILNWLPPSMIEMPSPAMSVLKAYLSSKGYNVSILYWNLKMRKMQKEFVWGTSTGKTSEFHDMLLLNNYLAIKFGDKMAYAKVKSALITLKPQYLSVDLYYFDHHMETYAQKLEELIDEELVRLNFDKILYIGFSVNLYQWICGTIIAKKIKELKPNIPIVIGGIGTKDAAVAFLKNFNQFDIALWGEGENSLTWLTDYLTRGGNSINDIPNIAVRQNDDIVAYSSRNLYADLNSIETQPEFDDYFEQLEVDCGGIDKVDVNLFIEGSRSCHWKKCKFCYLNTGYKHRLRSVDEIEKYLRMLIAKYNCMKYCFLDNDVIANDWERFSQLLDVLILIKNDYPDFQIILAEIVTNGITESFVRKMAMAGFTHVQIGYESASNNLLRKINKKNTFASNLLFIKYAIKYNILIGGANIICGLLEETYADVLEAIENIHYLRFFFQQGEFRHTISRLGILNSSRYYPAVKDEISSYQLNASVSMLPDGYVSQEALLDCTITERMVPTEKSTWSDFKSVEMYYLSSKFEYKIYKKESGIVYKEYLNKEIINELEIEYSSLEYLILKKANDSVCSFDELKASLKLTNGNEYITDCEIFNLLEELKKEGLIYSPSDFGEIVTILDINNII